MSQKSTTTPIKILFCIDNLLRGGTELQLIGLIERLDPAKYTPYLLTIRPSDPQLTPKNCHHLAWSVPKLFSVGGLRSLLQLVSWLRSEKIDVVQTFFQDSTLFAGTAAILAQTPARIACFRDLGFWYSKKQALLLKLIYKRMTGFICNADIVRQHFIQLFQLPEHKLHVLRNGIQVDSLAFIDHGQACATIGIVGNMTRQVKRTDLFIKAAAIVHQQYPDRQWHILGDGHLRAELEQLAISLGVHQQIHFAGRIDDVAGYLEKLDAGVICSDSEGLSNALLEYMFKGVAAVATNVGGNPELIDDGKTGLLVPPNDEQALANALLALIEDGSLKQRLAHNARQKVEQEYSWDICLKAHDNFYRSMLTKKK